jgi:hypothetical protein
MQGQEAGQQGHHLGLLQTYLHAFVFKAVRGSLWKIWGL